MSKFLQKKTIREKSILLAEDSKKFCVEFDANLNHLKKITFHDLIKIFDDRHTGDDAIDYLCKYSKFDVKKR